MIQEKELLGILIFSENKKIFSLFLCYNDKQGLYQGIDRAKHNCVQQYSKNCGICHKVAACIHYVKLLENYRMLQRHSPNGIENHEGDLKSHKYGNFDQMLLWLQILYYGKAIGSEVILYGFSVIDIGRIDL